MNTENIQDIYPLSPMQQGMLFHSIQSPHSGVYVEQLSVDLTGPLDIAAFEKAWQTLIGRNDIFRTGFIWEGLDEPVQVVFNSVDFSVDYLDWKNEGDLLEKKIAKFSLELRQQGFDFATAPLIKVTLVRTGEQKHKFIWTHHHVLFDGWSLPIILNDIFTLYEGLSRGLTPPLPNRPQFKEYVAWLQRQDLGQAELYWNNLLGEANLPTPLAFSKMSDDPGVSLPEYGVENILLSTELTEKIQLLAKENQLTLNTIMQGAWAILLNRYSGESDIVFGTTVSGRPPEIPGIDSMIGLFINTVPLKATVNNALPLVEWLQNLQKQQAQSRQFDFSSLIQIKQWAKIPGDRSLFDSILVFENYPISDELGRNKQSIELSNVQSESQTNLPIAIAVSPGKQIGIELPYIPQEIHPTAVCAIKNHIVKLLNSMASQPNALLHDLEYMDEKQVEHAVNVDYLKNSTFTPNQSIPEIFEDCVRNNSENRAVVCGDEILSYKKLHEKANKLARLLINRGVQLEDRIGIHIPKCANMIVAMLAIQKAGGCYVPLDPEYPVERLKYMIEDSGLKLVLAENSHILDELDSIELIDLNGNISELEKLDDSNLDIKIDPHNLAYIIYTSGSTGRPKGSMLTHFGLANHIHAYNDILDRKTARNGLQFSSLNFDASVFDIYVNILNGSALHLKPQRYLLDPNNFSNVINDENIEFLCVTPSMLHTIDVEQATNIKYVVVGGESCPAELAEKWSKDRVFINAYGPTETTVVTSNALYTNFSGAKTTIGKPIENCTYYVLNQQGHLVPPGVPGELYIAGYNLGRGYLNKPDLTADRFLPNPFSKIPGDRIYRTGDLVQMNTDGEYEFLGRIDQQVKVRGFRIELGEIENTLNIMPGIVDAAVIAYKHGPINNVLVAYIVPAHGTEFSNNQLSDYLKSYLPEYMVPSLYMYLDELPLTPNKKLDRKALPKPQFEGGEGEHSNEKGSPTLQIISGIFEDVLQQAKVGIHDNFFDLGGHSLLATQLLSRLRETFQKELAFEDIFELPTIAALTEKIDHQQNNAAVKEFQIPVGDIKGDIPLSFSQKRLWFLDQLEPNGSFYNIPIALNLTGMVDKDALEKSLNIVVERHAVLRTTFDSIEGKPVQKIADDFNLQLEFTDLVNIAVEEQDAQVKDIILMDVKTPFNLSQGPLLRAKLIKLADEKYTAYICMHHIISDGWSINIIVGEMAEIYRSLVEKKVHDLEMLPVQYAHFAKWQEGWLEGEYLTKSISYWKNKLAGAPSMLELPTDFPRPAVQSFKGASFQIEIKTDLASAIKSLSRQEGVTPFMTMLSAFSILLYKQSGQKDFNIGTPIAGRNRKEIENLIGFFVNNLVMRFNFDNDLTFVDLLSQVRQDSLEAYANQDVPFELLVEELHPQRDLSHSPLFQVMFVFQNLPFSGMDLPGLKIEPIEHENGTSNFDVSLIVNEGEDSYLIEFEYNCDLFSQNTIKMMAERFENILTTVAQDPMFHIADIEVLTKQENSLLLSDWNQTAVHFDPLICAHEIVEKYADETPNALAVSFDGKDSLSYAELNSRANQLARYLVEKGVKKESIVGISVNRSVDMVVGIVGILKAGGAFLSIDPTYPADRIEFMVQDSGISLLLTQSLVVGQLPVQNIETFLLDTQWPELSKYENTNIGQSSHSQNMAYVIYTSGSTGRPKGTMLHHQGLVNLAQTQQKAFNITQQSRILQFSSLSFDASVWELVMALLNGASLFITDQHNLASGFGLLATLKDNEISTVTLPPSVLAVVPEDELPALKTIITAGEACSVDLVNKWGETRQFINAYGPTETTVCASMYECSPHQHISPPIGRPIDNAKLYIVDSNLNLVPIGVPGELLVGGPSLARGYLHRPDLTAEKFVPDPFSRVSGARLYRTGDLVKYLPDGNISFLGRIDHQVKVRGFRIELGEIETVLSEHEALDDVIVLAREDMPGDVKLVAYLICSNGYKPTINEMRNHLRDRLPEYMVPAVFMYLEKFPLTPSGKIDRDALPVPEKLRPELETEYVAPRNDTEKTISEICKDLLQIEKVGIYDNFFDLGGHSLLATQFMSRIRNKFEIEVPLRLLFEKPNVIDLAREIDELKITRTATSTSTAPPSIKAVSRERHRKNLADLNNLKGS